MAAPMDIDRLVLLRSGILTLAAGIVVSVIAALTVGVPGLVGAIFATLVVLVFFSAGQLTLGRVLRNNPQMALSVALVIYLAKIGALFVLIILFADTTLFDTKTFALTVVICTIAWTIVEVFTFARTKVLYVDPSADQGAGK